jgi:hypothetical protein
MLSDREGLMPPRSATPSADAREPMREVLVRPAIKARIEEIEPAAGAKKHEGAHRPRANDWVMLHDGDLPGLKPSERRSSPRPRSVGAGA